MSREVQTEAAKKALLALARTEFDAAAHTLAVVLDEMTGLVPMETLDVGNVVRLTNRRTSGSKA